MTYPENNLYRNNQDSLVPFRTNVPEADGYVYTKYITRNGKRIYHPRGKVYRFPVKKT